MSRPRELVSPAHAARAQKGQPSPWAALFAVYCTACFAGGALAAIIFRVTNAKEFEGKGFNEKTPLKEGLAQP